MLIDLECSLVTILQPFIVLSTPKITCSKHHTIFDYFNQMHRCGTVKSSCKLISQYLANFTRTCFLAGVMFISASYIARWSGGISGVVVKEHKLTPLKLANNIPHKGIRIRL